MCHLRCLCVTARRSRLLRTLCIVHDKRTVPLHVVRQYAYHEQEHLLVWHLRQASIFGITSARGRRILAGNTGLYRVIVAIKVASHTMQADRPAGPISQHSALLYSRIIVVFRLCIVLLCYILSSKSMNNNNRGRLDAWLPNITGKPGYVTGDCFKF